MWPPLPIVSPRSPTGDRRFWFSAEDFGEGTGRNAAPPDRYGEPDEAEASAYHPVGEEKSTSPPTAISDAVEKGSASSGPEGISYLGFDMDYHIMCTYLHRSASASIPVICFFLQMTADDTLPITESGESDVTVPGVWVLVEASGDAMCSLHLAPRSGKDVLYHAGGHRTEVSGQRFSIWLLGSSRSTG